MKSKAWFAVSFGVILNWLSLFLSYKAFPFVADNIYASIASGGFPIKAFEYPLSPMGNDWPPAHMWPMFFLNLAVWVAVGFVVSAMIGKRVENKKLLAGATIAAILLSVIGLVYLVLQFD
ncbi:MAG: hypothetical protein WCJ29_01390 [bacterium]